MEMTIPNKAEEIASVLPQLYYLAPRLLVNGLNETKIGVLLVIDAYEAEGKECTSMHLRKSFWEKMSSQKISRTMTELSKEGYVNIDLAQKKTLRKGKLTAKGKQVIQEILKKWSSFVEICFGDLSVQEQINLMDILKKIEYVFKGRVEDEL